MLKILTDDAAWREAYRKTVIEDEEEKKRRTENNK